MQFVLLSLPRIVKDNLQIDFGFFCLWTAQDFLGDDYCGFNDIFVMVRFSVWPNCSLKVLLVANKCM